jgi:GLPGLI family protein
MKTIYTSFLLILLSVTTYGQQFSGIILYEEKIKLQLKIEGDAPPEMNMLPKEQTNKKRLIFNADASLYVANGEQTPNEIDQQVDGGGTIRIKMDRPDEKSYCDIKKGLVIEQREFMTRKFLVTSDLSLNNWKLSGQQKMVAGFPCQEATRTEGEKKISAWFAPSIRAASGPGRFAGLPGMVLEVSINNGEVIIIATSVEFTEVDAKTIVSPEEGKKVTWEEFDKIRKEKMKEMGEQNGGDGNVMIKIRK